MMNARQTIGARLAVASLALGLLTPIACRSAEPFSFGDDGGLGFGGSGGFGTLPVSNGSGGSDNGSGGSDNSSGGASGTGGAGTSGTGTGGASVDAAPFDAPSVRDVRAPVDIMPEGPLTAINCYLYAAYKPNAPYTDGARVFQLRDLRVYECKPWPYSGWCSQDAYEPGGPTGYWPDAWTPIGYCE